MRRDSNICNKHDSYCIYRSPDNCATAQLPREHFIYVCMWLVWRQFQHLTSSEEYVYIYRKCWIVRWRRYLLPDVYPYFDRGFGSATGAPFWYLVKQASLWPRLSTWLVCSSVLRALRSVLAATEMYWVYVRPAFLQADIVV